jgi:hypothetical protein
MIRLQPLLSFFALPAERQLELLPEIQHDRGAADYYAGLPHNPLLILVRGVFDEYTQPESESDADYQTRTGMQTHRSCAALNELCAYIYLLRHHYCADDYWTKRALTSKDEWRLFRRLAGLALEEMGWKISCTRQEIQEVVDCLQRDLAHA